MAGGPLFPHSAYPVTSGRVFPNVHAATSAHCEGLGVEASVGADSIWRLWFQMPGTLPSGTGKLLLRALANATSGNAKVNPKWKSFAVEETVSSPSLNAETVQTVTWGASDNDQFKEIKLNLDADTLVGGEQVIMDLTFETSSWTLAQVSTWVASIIWE
jgi:hypothetical protein